MRSIEAEGETIDEAIANALRVLKVARERVEVEILVDATRGLFGFGGKRARVRATLRRSIAEALSEASVVPRETSVPLSQPMPRAAEEETHASSAGLARSVPRTRAQARDSAAPAEVTAMAARARQLLLQILGHLGVSGDVRIREAAEPGTIGLEVAGDEGGLIIGRRGQTLDALEYVLNRMIGRENGGAAGRIVIDVEHYRRRRQEYLESLARRLADKVTHSGRTVTLNPMSPRDRRIVHLTLHGNAAVTTRSQGEGLFRRVLIVPSRPGRATGPQPVES